MKTVFIYRLTLLSDLCKLLAAISKEKLEHSPYVCIVFVLLIKQCITPTPYCKKTSCLWTHGLSGTGLILKN